MARRDEGAYLRYVTEEQRSQAGWIGREIDRLSHSRALSGASRRGEACRHAALDVGARDARGRLVRASRCRCRRAGCWGRGYLVADATVSASGLVRRNSLGISRHTWDIAGPVKRVAPASPCGLVSEPGRTRRRTLPDSSASPDSSPGPVRRRHRLGRLVEVVIGASEGLFLRRFRLRGRPGGSRIEPLAATMLGRAPLELMAR
jgi:hypothetical protein